MEPLTAVADQFKPQGKVIRIQPYGNGLINDTFLVTLDGLKDRHFILQRVNTRIFRRPELVMRNIRTYSEHLRNRQGSMQLEPGRRWEAPQIFLTKTGDDHWIGPDGFFWRAMSFIEGARSYESIQDIGHAQEVGYALAMFHRLTKDLPFEALADTLKGFHITPHYLKRYDRILGKANPDKSPEVKYALDFIDRRRAFVGILERAKKQGILSHRPIHGDPKVNNVMIDTTTSQAMGLIDLDTVKPGLIHYDIGDCLRSCCNPQEEDFEQWERVRFDLDYCRAVLKGYLPIVKEFLGEKEYDFLYDAVRLITLELGLRFFTDYLEGDVYWKIDYEGQNLRRALGQFKLAESIESQEAEIQSLIREMR